MWDFLRGALDHTQDPKRESGGGNGNKPQPPVVSGTSAGGPQAATTADEAGDQHAAALSRPKASASPALDRVLGDPSGRADEEGQRQLAERNAAGAEAQGPTAPLPRNYDQYSSHLKGEYAEELEAMRKHREQFEAEGGAEKRKTQKLALTPEEIAASKEELEKKKGTMSEDDLASEQARIKAMEQALPSAGKSMPQLKDEAQQLRDQISALGGNPKDPAVVEARKKLEGVMQASMILGKQIDPKGSEMGRLLYNKLDKEENPALTEQARGEGMGEEDVARGAVDQRNWLRKFVRAEMMDPTAAEILYLRDEGKTGSREGMSFEQVQAKETRGLKESGELPKDFNMANASEEQKNQVYAAVIGSAKQTNPGVNASTTGSATGMREPEKPKPTA